jgi:putative tricarboxylic transport membrane protein
MPRADRRAALARLARYGVAGCAAGATPAPWAQGARAKLAARLRLVIPGGARGHLDEAGRALGDTLVVLGLCDEIEYTNLDTQGGATALAYFADKHAQDPDALLMVDTGLVGAAALHAPAQDLLRLTPLARLSSDYPVLVVPSDSPIRTVADLSQRSRSAPKPLSIGVGAPGSVDHIAAGLMALAVGGTPSAFQAVPFARNFELADAVARGQLPAAVSAYRTFATDVASGRLRAVGVATRKPAYGLRPLREQGLDVDLVNWRAVFTGPGVPKERQGEMVDAVRRAVNDGFWRRTVQQNYWESSWLVGRELAITLEIDIRALQLAVQLLKLRA